MRLERRLARLEKVEAARPKPTAADELERRVRADPTTAGMGANHSDD